MFNRYKQPWDLLIIGGTILMLLFLWVISSSAYTVQKGDTLSRIAERELGEMRKWKDLAVWNNLEVEWIDGMAYVWLRIGQEIVLSPEKEHLDPFKIHQYFQNTKLTMEREIFRMAGIKNPSSRWNPTVTVTLILETTPSIRRTIFRLQRWIEELEIQGRYKMVDEIFDWTLADWSLSKFFPNEPYWIVHRKMCLFLMGLLDIESNGYFAKSHAGAYGPWQFLPSTYTRITGDPRDARKVLMTESLAGLKAALLYLGHTDTKRQALMRYNPNVPYYVGQVLAAYNKMLGRAEELEG